MDNLLSNPRFQKFYEEAKAKRLKEFGEEEDHLTVALNWDINDMMSALALFHHKSLEHMVKIFIMIGVEQVANDVADMPERKRVAVDAETYDLVNTIAAALGGSADAITRELITEAHKDLAEKQEELGVTTLIDIPEFKEMLDKFDDCV